MYHTAVRQHPLIFRRAGPSIVARPIIRRTRSWRGIMQVRFNDSRADHKRLGLQAFVWSPLRMFGLALTLMTLSYIILGHDVFMFSLLGYESEMQYEKKVNPSSSNESFLSLIDKDKNWKSPVRDLEKPLHPRREFDLFKERATSANHASASEQ